MLESMTTLTAHVKNGQLVLDEPVELHEGATAVVHLLDEDERAELERAIEEGAEDFERGDFSDAREFAMRLAAKP